MTYHWTLLDQDIANHINQYFKDLGYGFLNQAYSLMNGHIDIHGDKVKTFSHAIKVMVDDGFFICYYSEIIQFLEQLTNEYGHLPYNRSSRSFNEWSCDQLWLFYRNMIIRTGIKYIDMLRKTYCINYNGMKY